VPEVNARYPALDVTAIDAIVDATVQVAVRRLSGDLSAAETERLRDRARQLLASAECLHAYPLGNADEPAFVLGLPGGRP
jgi:hypothetical protein